MKDFTNAQEDFLRHLGSGGMIKLNLYTLRWQLFFFFSVSLSSFSSSSIEPAGPKDLVQAPADATEELGPTVPYG